MTKLLLYIAAGYLALKALEGASQASEGGEEPWYADYLASVIQSGEEDGGYATLFPVGNKYVGY